ncbi:MAG TPA: hypothetical protein VFU88_07585 [Ktedonobacterales bacterium]|nr:hypothetical protein [Ktedonobacterales bacterium]
MEPEEMDLVELTETVAVESAWRLGDKPEDVPALLQAGQQGMVVHCREQDPPLYDVEFLDPVTGVPQVLAVLGRDQIRVVERDTLSMA